MSLQWPVATVAFFASVSDGAPSEDAAWYARESALWTEATCPRCPSCLSQFYEGCLPPSAFVHAHMDCSDVSASLCSRGIYECPKSGVFFTHPMMTHSEVSGLYANSYHGQNKLGAASQRILDQAACVLRNVQGISKTKTIAEIGCTDGVLLKKLASEGNTVVCFEPTPGWGARARNVLETTRAKVHVVETLFDSSHPLLDGGTNLFPSSHVLEHVPDLCGFAADLHAKMTPGGIVFTEVPNHSREYIRKKFGGKLHLTFPDQYGFHSIMHSAGFALVDEAVYGADEMLPITRGWHTRSIFVSLYSPYRRKQIHIQCA